MSFNNNIKTLHLTIHLGAAISFDIDANESPTATGASPNTVTGGGVGPRDADFLREVLNKLVAAYGQSPSIKLCIVNGRIVRDALCSNTGVSPLDPATPNTTS